MVSQTNILDELFFYIRSAPLKEKIINELIKGPKPASTIQKIINKPRPSISRALKEMKEKELVKCNNETYNKYRFYSLTELGQKLHTKMKEME